MEENKEETKKMQDVLLPGFRFHPTDEELVSFYLKRKVEHRPISIKLITQLDIYKYDPWDLPKFAMMGEKEWYFYCPRDRKYRNSTRPNRVTSGGFWKATGTDRPIYSSVGSKCKCIGLRKSLVFYKGRAAKGIKTDWMMHEFRLPCASSHNNIHDSWAICRILKKTNTTTLRAISYSFVSSLPTEASTDTETYENPSITAQVCSDKILKYSSCFKSHYEDMDVAQYFDDKEATKTSTCKTTSPFSYLEFNSSDKLTNFDSLSPSLEQQYMKGLLRASQETKTPQFSNFINNNDMISLFLLNTSSSDSTFQGVYTNHIGSNIDLTSAILAQEQCPALVSLPQEYHETGFEGNTHGWCESISYHNHAPFQNQKHHMLL